MSEMLSEWPIRDSAMAAGGTYAWPPVGGDSSMKNLWALTASASELDAARRDSLSREMKAWLRGGHEGVVLATCHRVELYGTGAPPAIAAPTLRCGASAISHLLRVAAGLESVIVGEDEVLHQVREAHRSASRDRYLQRLFETAIATGRRARSRRTESPGNIAQNAVSWLRGRALVFGRTVIVVGAGRMGAALAHSFNEAGARITIASRDPVRAARLAGLYAGSGVGLADGASLTERAVAVAVALGGPWDELASITVAKLPPIADISAPQAIPDSVRRGLNGGFLGIDDLYHRSEPLPTAYIKDAEAIVARKTDEYMVWLERAR